MSICLRHVEAIVCNHFFLHGFCLCIQLRRVSKGQTYPVIDSPVHGEHGGENCSSVPQFVGKLQPFL